MAGTRIGGLEAPATDPVGHVMAGRFKVGRMLGAGGMGTVHEATDIAMGRRVALKLLRPELARDQHQLQRFEREARAAGKLSHPNVVGVTELLRDETLGLGLVMELLAGKSLATRLEEGPLSESEAVDVMMQALDGLSAAHDAGMVHRDLKPSNVFLVPIANGQLVKLLDFGIVKLAEDGAVAKLTRKGALIGTPTYMSPEQVSCAPVDARSDVYSMGACLYEALVAEPPYDGPHPLALVAAVGAGPPRDLHEIDRGISPDLVHVVRVAMSRDPAGRYQTAAAMREAMRGAVIQRGPRVARSANSAQGAGVDASTASALLLPSHRTRDRVGLAVVVLVVVALLAGALSLVHRPRATHVPTVSSLPTSATPIAPRALPAPSTPIAPPPATTQHTVVQDTPPRGLEPPEPAALDVSPRTTRIPRPRAPTTERQATRAPAPQTGRVGEDVLDPFAH